jgi:hypothetical protein
MPAAGAGLQTRLFHSRHMRHVQDAGSEEPPPKKVHPIGLPGTRRVVTSGRRRAFYQKKMCQRIHAMSNCITRLTTITAQV